MRRGKELIRGLVAVTKPTGVEEISETKWFWFLKQMLLIS